MLDDKHLPVRLQIAGIGEETDNLKALAQQLGIAEKVSFLGGVRDLSSYFPKAQTSCSTHPMWPATTARGWATIFSKPVSTAPRLSAMMLLAFPKMVINGQTGYCTHLARFAAFSAAVETLVNDADLRRRYGDALNRHVTHLCSDEEIYRTTMAAYRSVTDTQMNITIVAPIARLPNQPHFNRFWNLAEL